MMNKETAEALEGSIAKWDGIVAGTGGDEGSQNCNLCEMFYDSSDDEFYNCVGCPIFEKTGAEQCVGTPWQKWASHHLDDGNKFPWFAATAEQKKLAQAELDFLKSLREPIP